MIDNRSIFDNARRTQEFALTVTRPDIKLTVEETRMLAINAFVRKDFESALWTRKVMNRAIFTGLMVILAGAGALTIYLLGDFNFILEFTAITALILAGWNSVRRYKLRILTYRVSVANFKILTEIIDARIRISSTVARVENGIFYLSDDKGKHLATAAGFYEGSAGPDSDEAFVIFMSGKNHYLDAIAEYVEKSVAADLFVQFKMRS